MARPSSPSGIGRAGPDEPGEFRFETAESFQDLSSSLGFGLRFAVGKEWWVSDHWGLGMALEFDFSTNRVTSLGFTETWTSFGGGLVFSATYN